MRVLAPLILVFSMFSRLPMPQRQLQERDNSFALCAFPLVGLVQGGLAVLWGWLAGVLAVPVFLTAVVFTLLPLAFNGGIHLDGFCDTADALASHAPPPRRLEILKDPHLGAFGAMALCGHLLFLLGLFSTLSLTWANLLCLLAIYGISRVWSGLGMLYIPYAKPGGMSRSFTDYRVRRPVTIVLLAYMLLAAVLLVWQAGWLGLVMALTSPLIMPFYRYFVVKNFGGITGDLQGWFVQSLELLLLAELVAGGLLQ